MPVLSSWSPVSAGAIVPVSTDGPRKDPGRTHTAGAGRDRTRWRGPGGGRDTCSAFAPAPGTLRPPPLTLLEAGAGSQGACGAGYPAVGVVGVVGRWRSRLAVAAVTPRGQTGPRRVGRPLQSAYRRPGLQPPPLCRLSLFCLNVGSDSARSGWLGSTRLTRPALLIMSNDGKTMMDRGDDLAVG